MTQITAFHVSFQTISNVLRFECWF